MLEKYKNIKPRKNSVDFIKMNRNKAAHHLLCQQCPTPKEVQQRKKYQNYNSLIIKLFNDWYTEDFTIS